jgi:hypothetical protein
MLLSLLKIHLLINPKDTQLLKFLWVLQISSRIHNKKFTEYCLFKGVISKNLSDMNTTRKIEFPPLLPLAAIYTPSLAFNHYQQPSIKIKKKW